MTQEFVVAMMEGVGTGFDWVAMAPTAGPLYKVIINAPEIDSSVPMILIQFLEHLQSSFSILKITASKKVKAGISWPIAEARVGEL